MKIGIDIGGTNTKAGIVDSSGKILEKAVFCTADYAKVEDFVEKLNEVLQPMIAAVGGKNCVAGIGVGAPNANHLSGNIEYAPNLRWKGIVPLGRLVGETFGLPCCISNDANAAALGEMTFGAARGMRDFIMITLGTGLGSGIVAGGQLLYGHDGLAGELGHTKITHSENGRLCGCGHRGCLEAYVSASGVAQTARDILKQESRASLLREIPQGKITSKDVFDAAQKGDSIALSIFEFTGKILGEAFANFAAFSSPEAIVLFGGLAKAGDILLQPVRRHFEANLLPVWKGKIRLLLSELPEDDAGILGAASLILI